MKTEKKLCNKIVIKLTTAIFIVQLLLSVFVSCGGSKLIPYTVSSLETKTKKTFFDENGSKMEIWEKYLNSNKEWLETYRDIKIKDDFVLQKVTGFTISELNWIGGTDKMFLVEFEPQGYFTMAAHSSNPPIASFSPFPSPYKLLNISEEDRFFITCADEDCFGAMINGRITSIFEHAYYGNIYEYPYEGWVPKKKIYNQEDNCWKNE